MSQENRKSDERGGDWDGPDAWVAATAIRDAAEAMEAERPDLARRLRILASELHNDRSDDR